ncbi:hypothetical protein [Moorena sp. SIO3H5]|uniref:hypothetical protein n=1 Tax=Moorena sp. SIO3H5 TaxID=2607834 RepID=UPI0013BE42C8|nr:hypothetical protein [Moorena sp. SIO3H5]NEO73440.1 hypothetical protein [Moorena sp. SIO3H5]
MTSPFYYRLNAALNESSQPKGKRQLFDPVGGIGIRRGTGFQPVAIFGRAVPTHPTRLIKAITMPEYV